MCYENLVGLGFDGADVMLGTSDYDIFQLKARQPALVSFHYKRHLAAFNTNHARKVLPNYFDDITIQIRYFFCQKSPK